MSRQDWKYLWFLIKDIAKDGKSILVNLFVKVLSNTMMVYVGIIGMGLLLDEIYAGAEMRTLVKYVLLVLLAMLFCTVLNSRTTENFNRIRDLAKDTEAGNMNRKSLFWIMNN